MLERTTFIPYGAVEEEPSFPSTNLGMEGVRKALDLAVNYRGLKGVMGNNELLLLQFPRTFYFLKSTWDTSYESASDREVYKELAEKLYPDNAVLIAQAYEALNEEDFRKVARTLTHLREVIDGRKLGRPGAIGRYLLPDSTSVAGMLLRQIEIQLARQTLIQALNEKATLAKSEELLGNYLVDLLAWNEDTGWDKMLQLGIWTDPICRSDASLSRALAALRNAKDPNGSRMSEDDVNALFNRVATKLLTKYDKNSVMIGCITPMKKAVLESR